jgi:hypothetical protein
MEMSGQLHAPAALPLYPLDRRLGGPQSVCTLWTREKSYSAGNITRVVDPVSRRYTD